MLRRVRNFAVLALVIVAVLYAGRTLFRGGGGLSGIGTDAEISIIPAGELMSGGPPPQGIPALGFAGSFTGSVGPSPEPRFVEPDEAATWIEPLEPVIALDIGEEARIYPLQVLTWHEIANDVVGGVPVAVTFCPLCNSAFAFDLRVPLTEAARDATLAHNPDAVIGPLDGEFLDAYAAQHSAAEAESFVASVRVTFGTSGMLYNSNLVMFDSGTGTLWPQVLAGGAVGTLTGVSLLRYNAQIVAFEAAVREHPEALVLSRDTGFRRAYGNNPYVGYDRVDNPPFLFRGREDGRLEPKMRVVAFEIAGEPVAYPFEDLVQARVVNDVVGGVPVAVFWEEGTRSALDQGSIAGSQDVGAVGAFRRRLGDRTLTFGFDGETFVDSETGSRWNLFGRAVAGELEGQTLAPVVHDNTLWFAWAAFKPETRVYALR